MKKIKKSNKQKIYVINFKDKTKQAKIIYKKKKMVMMIRERDETSFLQEAHIARRVLDTFAQRFDN